MSIKRNHRRFNDLCHFVLKTPGHNINVFFFFFFFFLGGGGVVVLVASRWTCKSSDKQRGSVLRCFLYPKCSNM